MLLRRIYSPEELKERAEKAPELNGFAKPPYDPNNDPEVKKAKAALYDKNGFPRVTLIVKKVPLNPSPLMVKMLRDKAEKALKLNSGF